MLLRYAQYKGVVNLDICEEGDAIMADKGLHLENKRKESCHMKWKQQKLLPT